MSELNKLLAKWNEAKKDLAHQEEKVERYKKKVEELMKDQLVLSSEDFIVTKRSITRETVSQQSMPAELWRKYANRSTFNAFYLKHK